MTDDATNGRPWPIDPSVAPPPEPLAVPDGAVGDPAPDPLAAFADRISRTVPVAETEPPPAIDPPTVPAPPERGQAPVSDEDRAVYGVLLDRASERGLLSEHDYQVRLGELATATSIDQMRKIVTDLPAFTTPRPSPPAHRSRRTAPAVAPDMALAAVGGRRRSSPWVLLGIMVVVLLASLVLFLIYAEHLVLHHNAGLVSTLAASRTLSAPRL